MEVKQRRIGRRGARVRPQWRALREECGHASSLFRRLALGRFWGAACWHRGGIGRGLGGAPELTAALGHGQVSRGGRMDGGRGPRRTKRGERMECTALSRGHRMLWHVGCLWRYHTMSIALSLQRGA